MKRATQRINKKSFRKHGKTYEVFVKQHLEFKTIGNI